MSIELAESIWHERLRRRLHPDTMDAKLRGLAHELLWAASRRAPAQDIERETGRVLDELGIAVGIGPKPC
jgi:hypothetical protein